MIPKGYRRFQILLRVAIGIVAGVLFNFAAAESVPEVRIVPELRIEEGPSQKPAYRYVPAVKVAEGQEIYYTIYVRNNGKQPLQDYVLMLPMPQNTRYVAGTAAGAGADITFSADGGQTFARPEQLRVEGPGNRIAPVSYTHIRWQWPYPLSSGIVVLARFRAVFK